MKGMLKVAFNTLTYEKKGRAAICTIADDVSRKEKVREFSGELGALCREISADQDTSVMVLTGKKDHFFSMGKELIEEMVCDRSGVPDTLGAAGSIAALDIPVIAAINGKAIGLGLELALACDIRVADECSGFGLPHIKAGIIPWDGGTQRLSRLVGKSLAMEMILTGEERDAAEALRIGLVNKVVPVDELMRTVLDMAREIASKGPIALKYAKEAVSKGMDLTLNQGLRLEADLYFLLHTTRDRTEGINAFKEKRKAVFEGK